MKTQLSKAVIALFAVAGLTLPLGTSASALSTAAPVFVAQIGTASVQTVESVGNKLWAVGAQDDTVYVYDKATGALDNSYPLPACPGFTIRTSVDANYLWVQCNQGTDIFRVSLTTGAANAITLAANTDIFSDGKTVWVSATNRKVYRVDALTGTVLGSTDIPASAGKAPSSLVSDGTRVWVVYEYGAKLVQLNATTGAIVGSPIDTGIGGLVASYRTTVSGNSFFIASLSGVVQQRSLVDGSLTRTLTMPAITGVGLAAAFDATLWVVMSGSISIYQFDMSKFVDGQNPTPEATFTNAGNSGMRNMVYDGTNLFSADIGGRLNKYTAQVHSFVTPPAATSAPVVTPGVRSASLSWTAPATGTAPFTYTVTSEPAGPICVVTGTTAECTGLVIGTSYKFAVTSSNEGGSATSPQSAAVLPIDPNADIAPVEGDGDTAPKGVPSGGVKKFVPTNDSSFQLAWDKKTGKLISRATGIYTGYIQAVATFTVAGKTHTCSAVFGTLKAMPMKTAAQKTASMKSKTFTGKQFCIDKIKMDAKTLAPKGGMTSANFKKIKSMNKTSSELAKEKLALAALKNFTGEVQIQVTRYRAWPTTMVNIGDHNSKGGKIPFLIRNTKVNLG